jgi:hypothetical protein
LNFSGCKLNPESLAPLTEAVKVMGAVNLLTVDSTGDPRYHNLGTPLPSLGSDHLNGGPKSYTLTAEKTIDLSSKDLGVADVNLIVVWIKRPEVSAVLTELNVRRNEELDKEYSARGLAELRAAVPETCKLLTD